MKVDKNLTASVYHCKTIQMDKAIEKHKLQSMYVHTLLVINMHV